MKVPMLVSRVDRAIALLWPALVIALLAMDGPLPPSGAAGDTAKDPVTLVRDLAARSSRWLAPPGSLETLEYDFISGSDITRIHVSVANPGRPVSGMGPRSTPGSMS